MKVIDVKAKNRITDKRTEIIKDQSKLQTDSWQTENSSLLMVIYCHSHIWKSLHSRVQVSSHKHDTSYETTDRQTQQWTSDGLVTKYTIFYNAVAICQQGDSLYSKNLQMANYFNFSLTVLNEMDINNIIINKYKYNGYNVKKSNL